MKRKVSLFCSALLLLTFLSPASATALEPNSVASVFSRYIENKSFRELYAERSYNFCKDNFTLHIVIQKLINMYSQILNDTKTVNNFKNCEGRWRRIGTVDVYMVKDG